MAIIVKITSMAMTVRLANRFASAVWSLIVTLLRAMTTLCDKGGWRLLTKLGINFQRR